MRPRSPQLFAVSLAAVAACGVPDPGTQSVVVTRTPSGGALFVAGDLGADRSYVDGLFGVDASELTPIESRVDSLGYRHQRFAQRRSGLPVVSGDYRVTRDRDGRLVAASGASWFGAADVADTPALSASEAEAIALASTAGGSAVAGADLVYIAPSSGGAPALAWRSRVTGRDGELPLVDDVFVDATTGDLIDRHPQIHVARNRLTYDAAGSETNASLVRGENDPAVGDVDADRAHDAAGATYDCLQQLFGRDSYDGLGGDLVSIAHYGVDFQNAVWNGDQMLYGDGFAVLDVGTHELGHALTQHTAGLVYQNQPGALNESMSDILAAACESRSGGPVAATAWMIGEEVTGVGPFRYMNNPTRDGISSDHTSNLYTGTEDNGGVHLNSGVPNLAFVLLVEGGTHPRGLSPVSVQPIGVLAAAQIFHRALTNYLGANSDFVAARAATEQAAADLHGADSSEAISVSEAWAAVGVGGEPPSRDADTGDTDSDPDTDDDGDGEGGTEVGNLTGGCSTGGPGGSAACLLIALLAVRRRRRA